MSTSQNKEAVERYLEALTALDMSAMDECLDESLVYWVPGALPFSGSFDKAYLVEALSGLRNLLEDGGWTISIDGITAEGNRVAVEADGRMQFKSGVLYTNRYHFLFVLRGGKIIEKREYMDTHAALQLVPADG